MLKYNNQKTDEFEDVQQFQRILHILISNFCIHNLVFWKDIYYNIYLIESLDIYCKSFYQVGNYYNIGFSGSCYIEFPETYYDQYN